LKRLALKIIFERRCKVLLTFIRKEGGCLRGGGVEDAGA
jgi:hypothetical protein